MKIELKNSLAWKILFIALFSFFVLSSSISAQTIRLCNESGVDLRAARFSYRPSSLFSLDCGGFGTEGCHSWIFNWKFIGNGFCDVYYPGTFELIYFAVQLKDKDGNWYSTSYSRNQEILDGNNAGWSGLSNRKMCVKDNTYAAIYDRILKGMWEAVENEVCQTGYSKVAVNLYTQTDNNTNLTVSVPYEAPPVKKNYPNTILNSYGRPRPACGYTWVNSVSADYAVKLRPGFVTTPTGARPAIGYRWVKKIDTEECSVEPIPITKKTKPKKRIRKNK